MWTGRRATSSCVRGRHSDTHRPADCQDNRTKACSAECAAYGARDSAPRPIVVPSASKTPRRQAVQDRDQSRLAVAFHRLILPDGSWIDLEFTGLNQAGEGALRDQVDRHYFSTFAAAGAVGVVSGLALAGGSPFGLRAGVGQGLGQSATSVLDRFLNRLPTITIRAGHRLRIWFTSDVLVPRAGTRQ